MKKLIIFLFANVMAINFAFSQGAAGAAINTNGAIADPSALLDVNSTTSPYQGLLIPRLTTTQRNSISTPAQALQIYNTTTKCFEFWEYGIWQTVTCACNPVAAIGSITGNTSVCQGQINVAYSLAPVTNATGYVWTLPVGATIASGAGTNTITVTFGSNSGNITVAATNSCGTSATSILAVAFFSVPTMPGTPTGPTAVAANSTGNVYSVTAVVNATSYNWVLPTGATITSGLGTNTVTVTMGSTSGNVTVSASNSCGTSSASAPLAVAVCNTIALDATNQVCGTSTSNTFIITTTSANEIILIGVNGADAGAFNGSVAVTGAGIVTQVATVNGIYAFMALYACVPTAVGSHTITVTWGSNWTTTRSMAYAASFTGFCGIPTVSANVQSVTATSTVATTISASIIPATANSCLFGDYYSFTNNSPPGVVTWTNNTWIQNNQPITNGWDGSIAVKQLATTSAVTVTATDTYASYYTNGIVLILAIVHP